jgi:hypothetical protein
VTYNFDPERWYDSQLTLLKARHDRGEIDDAELQSLLEDLDKRYEDILDRLDGTYSIPESDS